MKTWITFEEGMLLGLFEPSDKKRFAQGVVRKLSERELAALAQKWPDRWVTLWEEAQRRKETR